MSRRKWTVTTHATGIEREVEVVVYDTVAILRREATRFAKHVGEPKPDFHDTEGVCHGFEFIHVADDGTETSTPLAAVIRLAKGHVTPLIVSHEIAHAAQHLYKLDFLGYDSKDLAGDHFHSANEDFAYLYGELFSAIWTTLEAVA